MALSEAGNGYFCKALFGSLVDSVGIFLAVDNNFQLIAVCFHIVCRFKFHFYFLRLMDFFHHINITHL